MVGTLEGRSRSGGTLRERNARWHSIVAVNGAALFCFLSGHLWCVSMCSPYAMQAQVHLVNVSFALVKWHDNAFSIHNFAQLLSIWLGKLKSDSSGTRHIKFTVQGRGPTLFFPLTLGDKNGIYLSNLQVLCRFWDLNWAEPGHQGTAGVFDVSVLSPSLSLMNCSSEIKEMFLEIHMKCL